MTKSLEQIGYSVTIEPILEIIPVRFQKDIFKWSKAFIVTSKHASSQIANFKGIDKSIPIYTIGSGTAESLIVEGFTNVHIATVAAKSLLDLIQNKQKLADGLITYLSGWNITQDLAHFLAMNGYKAQRVVCYKALQSQKLSPLTHELIKRKEIDCILFMSGRTADAFCNICNNNGLSKHLKSIIAVTMSEEIGNAIRKQKWQDIKVAKHPSTEAILETFSDIKRNKMFSKLGKVKFEVIKEKFIS